MGNESASLFLDNRTEMDGFSRKQKESGRSPSSSEPQRAAGESAFIQFSDRLAQRFEMNGFDKVLTGSQCQSSLAIG